MAMFGKIGDILSSLGKKSRFGSIQPPQPDPMTGSYEAGPIKLSLSGPTAPPMGGGRFSNPAQPKGRLSNPGRYGIGMGGKSRYDIMK